MLLYYILDQLESRGELDVDRLERILNAKSSHQWAVEQVCH